MDASVPQQPSVSQPPSEAFSELYTFGGVIKWLTRFIQLTEEDLENAGVYLGK